MDPIGSNKPIDINVRVVAATHKDLEAEVQAGRFREDLYYRLNVLPVTTPPLRERPEDIATLCEHFAKVHANPNKLPVELSERLMEELLSYPWPGNIRELSNLMARFSALFPGKSICYTDIPTMMLPKGLRDRLAGGSTDTMTVKAPEPSFVSNVAASGNTKTPVADEQESKAVSIQANDLSSAAQPVNTVAAAVLADVGDTPSALPETPLGPADYNPIEDLIALAQGTPLPAIDSIPLKQRIAELEKTLIEQALQQAEGNVSQTARILAIQRTTLIEKINKYNLKAQADEPSTA